MNLTEKFDLDTSIDYKIKILDISLCFLEHEDIDTNVKSEEWTIKPTYHDRLMFFTKALSKTNLKDSLTEIRIWADKVDDPNIQVEESDKFISQKKSKFD